MAVYIGKPPVRDAEIRIDPASMVVTLTLSAAAAAKLRRTLTHLNHPEDGGDDAYVSALRRSAEAAWPVEALALFDAIRSGAFAPTALIIAGLPFDKVTAAPLPGEAACSRKASDLSENLTVMLGALIGDPYGLAGEGLRLANDLIPTQADRNRFTGNGSERPLGFHTENAAHRRLFQDRDLSPLGLVLTGVSAQALAGPKTWIANGRLAAARLPAATYALLREPVFEIALPLRQRRPGAPDRTVVGPILSGPPGREIVTAAFYGDMMRYGSPAAAAAAKEFEAALQDVAVALDIVPSIAAYVPNAYALHARDGFAPRFGADGRAERWLQRVFVTGRLDGFDATGALSERVFVLPN